MRTLFRFFALWLVCIVSLASAIPVLAIPPMPSSFYGTVKRGGVNVSAGTTITASINGVPYANTTVQLYNGDTVYSLNVPGDDPDTLAIEGGTPGNTVVFTIGKGAADQAGTWQSSSNIELDLTAPPSFADVPSDHWAWSWIERLYAAGITGGCGTAPLVYCPEDPVTRAQMAVFLLRSEHGASYSPPPVTGVFADVPGDYWAAAWIEQLATEGITSGCGGGNYCPEDPVTRAQMAIFIVRTFNLP
jgi:S-layer homology domain